MADSRWAIEFDPHAAEAFRINHPEAQVVVNDISVLLQVGGLECVPTVPRSPAAVTGLQDRAEARHGAAGGTHSRFGMHQVLGPMPQ